MTTAFVKDAFYNLCHGEQGCADCIGRCCKSGTRPAQEDKSSLLSLHLILIEETTI